MEQYPSNQEIHENVREFFPDFDSVRNFGQNMKKKEKAVAARALGILAAAAVLTLALLPYIVCHPISIGEKDALLSARIINRRPETEVSYLIQKMPGMTDEEILRVLSWNPQLGIPFPKDGKIRLQGLDPRTPYQIIFFEAGDAAAGEQPSVVGHYSFKSGTVPTPELITLLDRGTGGEPSGGEPQRPEPPVPAEETTASTEETTEPTEETTAPTEETTVPTETTAPPEEPEPLPVIPPARPPQDPVPEPEPMPEPVPEPEETTEPPTLPPDPVFTPQQPGLEFLARSDGKFVFTASFPFEMDIAKECIGELTVERMNGAGETSTEGPTEVSVETSGNLQTVTLTDAKVLLGEQIRIRPVLFRLREDGTRQQIPGTEFEAAPAGAGASTKMSFQYALEGESMEYRISLADLINPGTPMPQNAGLNLSGLEFRFLDENHQPLTDALTVPMDQGIGGTSFSTAGTLPALPVPAAQIVYVEARANLAWRIGGEDALLSGTQYEDGGAIVETEAGAPTLQSAAAFGPDSEDTTVVVSFPFRARGVTPELVRLQAQGGAYLPDSAEEPAPVPDVQGRGTHQMTYVLSPGETVQFHGTLQYQENGESRTLDGPELVLSHPTITGAEGVFTHSVRDDSFLDYQISMKGITNPANSAGGGLKITGIHFTFAGEGGEVVEIQETNVGDEIPAGTDAFQKSGTLDLSALGTDSYSVTATIYGKWQLGGSLVQERPGIAYVGSSDPVVIHADAFIAALPSVPDYGFLTVTPLGIGVEDGAGTVVYQPDSVLAKPGKTVYIKVGVSGKPEIPCEIGQMPVTSPGHSITANLVSCSVGLPYPASGVQEENLEYIYSFSMPEADVLDLTVGEVPISWYDPIAVDPILYSAGMTPISDTEAAFTAGPALSGDVVSSKGQYYVKPGGTVTLSASIAVKVEETSHYEFYLRDDYGVLFTEPVTSFRTTDAEGNVTDGIHTVSITLTNGGDPGIGEGTLRLCIGKGTA